MASAAKEDTGQSSSALSNSSWSRLPQAGPPEEEEDAQCPICLGHMNWPARVIYCMHKFCLNCIWLWSEASDNCPLCRQPIYHMMYSVQGRYEYFWCVFRLASRVQKRMRRLRRGVQPVPTARLRTVQALQNQQHLYGGSGPMDTEGAQRQEAAPGPSNAHSQQAPAASQEMAPLRESEGPAGPAAPLEPQNGTE